MSWIYDVQPESLKAKLVEQGFPKFRAQQIQNWLHKGIVTTEDMSNLPQDVKAWLKDHFNLDHLAIEDVQKSTIDGSQKYLIRIGKENFVEAVVMRYSYGNTLCLSSQIGCRMGCVFCASTGAGFVRSLTAGEMLGQYALVRKALGEDIERVVVMGIGEPLEDLPALLEFIDRLHAEYNISKRRITVSTCGLVPQIYKLAEANEPITLAVSLHSAIQAVRESLMPIAKKYPLEELLQALRMYRETTGRRITYEYLMIHGLNDGEEDLEALIHALRKAPGHVNLIPFNAVEGLDFKPSTEKRMLSFEQGIEAAGFPVSRRRSLGNDITAACGQLRRQKQKG